MIYAKCIENEAPVSKTKYPLEIGKMYEVDTIANCHMQIHNYNNNYRE